ncbi:MAG: DUF4301 family protein [Alphaproteobacteria bacterium]|nr:DUF4301 family protein [Alphaproteobacteria bacterium]
MTNFTPTDIEQIKSHGLAPDVVATQIENFKSGFPWADIIRPCVLGDGINHNYTDENADDFVTLYREHINDYNVVKFVPASGAATRMFRDLFEFVNTGVHNKTTDLVLNNLTEFAFWDEIKQKIPDGSSDTQIIHTITDTYGNAPKALIPFHRVNDIIRTPVAEHLIEGAKYANTNENVNIHFTVSPEHIDGFNNLLSQILPIYESQMGVHYNISMSTQKPQTDTIAVNPDNTPFRDDSGQLLFRPAGHGALIENLNDIDADIIFIKNIDNVRPDITDTVRNKCFIGGVLIQYQNKIFEYLRAIDDGNADTNEIAEFIKHDLCSDLPNTDINTIHNILNRPLRVVGIVRNTGEPGGGPFWVRGNDGRVSLQIVEPGQIAPEKRDILQKSEFFSPTDIVCSVRRYDGKKFNLLDFVDATTGFISDKSSNGRPLRAMERPGLWNGSMAGWNTIFAVVPITTFTPVKMISDLLQPSHK